jgi:hypothetical protein
MNGGFSPSPDLSLRALRGAVGEVVGGAGCWDRVVSIWRIFWALDGLISVLWGIVHRLRAGEMLVGLDGPAEVVVASHQRPGRRRAVAGGMAMPGRRVLTSVATSVGGMRRERPRVDWDWRGRKMVVMPPVLAVRGARFSELGWGLSRNCILIVPD